MSIWINTLVQNEDRYLWYAVTSVINYIDKILIWDTGSTDNTPRIAKEIKRLWPGKVEFKEVGLVNPEKFTEVRSRMLAETDSDWIMVLDGDEVWWDDSIRSLTSRIRKDGAKLDSVVSRYINLVGDVFHYQDESAGKYRIKGKTGFLTIRAMNQKNINGLSIRKPHGTQGFYDSKDTLIQERDASKMSFLPETSFLHFTNLRRSGSRANDLKVPKRGFKLKHEIGHTFPLDYYYPEVFFRPKPDFVPVPWVRMDPKFYRRSLIETPLRKIKRRLTEGKSGY